MIYLNDTNIKIEQNSVVTLGNFDGVHLGHKLLINKIKECSLKYDLKSVVFSFRPHPFQVINDSKFSTILSSEEKVYLFSTFNIDYFIEYPFTKQFSKTTSINFIVNYLIKQLNCKILVVGEDYKFGKDSMSDTTVLHEICKKVGIKLIVVPLYKDFNDETKTGSRFIRQFILQKNLEDAQRLLGRPYFIMEQVLTGNRLGRSIGFPTINMITGKDKLLPPNGVYCTKTFLNGVLYNSVTNIGFRPTVSNNMEEIKTIETHLFDFNEEVYDNMAIIYFYKWMRGEIKFNDIDELKIQIYKDVIASKEIHNTIDNN